MDELITVSLTALVLVFELGVFVALTVVLVACKITDRYWSKKK